MNVIVNGPPITEADNALMPITAAALVSKSIVGHVMVIASASRCPPSEPIRSDKKNKPPRNPEPSEAIEAAILRRNTVATVRTERSSVPMIRNAPWPDDITCGDSSAISPTNRPPIVVRSIGRNRKRTNSASDNATPRIRKIPSTADNSPSDAARRRSWATMAVLSGATMPRSVLAL